MAQNHSNQYVPPHARDDKTQISHTFLTIMMTFFNLGYLLTHNSDWRQTLASWSSIEVPYIGPEATSGILPPVSPVGFKTIWQYFLPHPLLQPKQAEQFMKSFLTSKLLISWLKAVFLGMFTEIFSRKSGFLTSCHSNE